MKISRYRLREPVGDFKTKLIDYVDQFKIGRKEKRKENRYPPIRVTPLFVLNFPLKWEVGFIECVCQCVISTSRIINYWYFPSSAPPHKSSLALECEFARVMVINIVI